MPFSRRLLPSNSNDPINVGAKHFIKSSSTPPAVVTMQSTYLDPNSQLTSHDYDFRLIISVSMNLHAILCSTKNRIVSRNPDDTIFDV